MADLPLANLVLADPGATEGISTGSVRVASFHDTYTKAPVSHFTAVVAWGDGSTSTVAGTSGGIIAQGGGNFLVRSSHTYAEEGPYTLSVQILDVGGASVGGSRSIAVADAALGSLSLKSLGAVEGSGKTFTVATFFDPNKAAPATDFTATVSWGDGGTTTLSGAGGGIVATGGGNFALLAPHVYAEEGSYTLAVQVLDMGGSSVSGSRTITVADAALTGLALQNPHATEGLATGTLTVATFTDQNAAAPATDFTATVLWGDGSSSAASVVAAGSPGTFAVRTSGHTYAEEGTVTLSVQVRDVGGASAARALRITVADAPLSVSVQVPPATEGVDPGNVRVATFHDTNVKAPISDFTAVIRWGDGGTSTVTAAGNGIRSLGGGDFAVWSRHAYAAEEGTVTLSVQILDAGGASVSGSRSIPVADAALNSLVLTAPPSAVAGLSTGTFTVATFHDANTAAPATDFTAAIQWGDGSTSTVSGSGIVARGGGNFAVLSGHTWAAAGTYTLSVQVADVGGSSVHGSRSLSVRPSPLAPAGSTSSASNPPSVGLSSRQQLLADLIFLELFGVLDLVCPPQEAALGWLDSRTAAD